MTKAYVDSVIITDPQAEGSPKSHEEREPLSTLQAMTNASMHSRNGLHRAPIAETGVVAAVVLPGEGADDSEGQDAKRTTAETQAVSQPDPDLQRESPPTALIVEDTIELAEILQVTLQRMRMVAVHESNGGRAFARFNVMKPDIVLLDIGLPDGPGWKVLENIKEQQRATGGKMPIVIVITAYGDPANRLVGKLHDVYSYLIKPFTPTEVERVIRSALSSAAG